MGTKGAPIATVVGQIIAMLLGLYFNLTKNTDVQFNFKSIELESYYFKGICTVGIPTIIMQSMSSIMCFGINKLLLNFQQLQQQYLVHISNYRRLYIWRLLD